MVSVIIPTHNREALLPRAVASVLGQTCRDLELIVVDDASADGTQALLQGMDDPRLRVERLPVQSGACAARNRGIQLARGEYIAFQDSDDEWLPEKLEAQLAFLQAQQADLVFCAFQRCDSGGEVLQTFPHAETQEGQVSYAQLLFENLASTQCILGKADAVRALGFDERFPRMQDWEFILRAAQTCRVCYQKQALVRVYVQPDSLSAASPKAMAALRMLLRMHRRGIVADERVLQQWLFSLRHFASPQDRLWREYLCCVTARRGVKDNLRMVRDAWEELRGHGRYREEHKE